MRLIGGLLLMEVPLAIASAGWRLVLSILAPKALHRCPGLEQCAIHGKVFAGDQALHFISVQHGVVKQAAKSSFSTRSRFLLEVAGSHRRQRDPQTSGTA